MTAGDRVPDLTFTRPDGTSVPLSTFQASDYLLVIFLRHLV
jgi:hypothetical protein